MEPLELVVPPMDRPGAMGPGDEDLDGIPRVSVARLRLRRARHCRDEVEEGDVRRDRLHSRVRDTITNTMNVAQRLDSSSLSLSNARSTRLENLARHLQAAQGKNNT